MPSSTTDLAGLRTLQVCPSPDPGAVVVLLHGYGMQPDDLAPFASSMGIAARFYFPQGPRCAGSGGYAWWDVDPTPRAAPPASPRDLAHENFAGRPAARLQLCALLAEVRRRDPGLPVIIGGFSQGGMLACDVVLFEAIGIDGLVMMSSSCMALDEWQLRLRVLEALPVFISHGRRDADLAFSAGERLLGFLTAGGANVTWVPFDQGHVIPLPVWRELRKYIAAIARRASRQLT